MTLTEALGLSTPDVAARRHIFAHAADNTELDEYGRPVDRGYAEALVDTYAGVPRAEAMELFSELIGLAGEFEDVRCDRNSEFILTDEGEDQDRARDRYDRLITDALEKLVPAIAAYQGPLNADGRLTPTHHLDEVPA